MYNNYYIGPHISIFGGVENSIKKAYNLNSTAFGLFLKNPLQWKFPEIKNFQIEKFKYNCKKYNFSNNQILPHSSFLINLGHPDKKKLEKCRIYFLKEVKRCYLLGLKFLNVHPGSHLNQISENVCLKNISESINFVLNNTDEIIIIIENTAGQGTNVGYNFKHIAKIISNVNNKKRIGVCLDTCHLFASGYDLRNIKNCKLIFKNFDKVVNLKYLKSLHLNDSKKNFFSRKDRHENLGYGKIGKKFFSWIFKNKIFLKKPIILETPKKKLWKKELKWIKSKIKF
ncbi:deoxyribonuclease IV [Buchnera aphidicola]|uniref:deoxyribonuclease IV n=1 Tax=Buchnera aphidicola TaxID=9 RepID=UPI0030EC8BD5